MVPRVVEGDAKIIKVWHPPSHHDPRGKGDYNDDIEGPVAGLDGYIGMLFILSTDGMGWDGMMGYARSAGKRLLETLGTGAMWEITLWEYEK